MSFSRRGRNYFAAMNLPSLLEQLGTTPESVKVEARGLSPSMKKLASLVAAVSLAGGGLAFAFWGGGSTGSVATALASPTPAGPSQPEKDLEDYLRQGRQALIRQNLDKASTFALMGLRLAQSLDRPEAQNESLDILVTALVGQQKPEQALGYLRQIAGSALPTLARRHLETARSEMAQGQRHLVAREASIALSMIEAIPSPQSQLWELAAETFEQCQRLSEASRMRERLAEGEGEKGAEQLVRAAELAEQVGETERALQLLERLVAREPREKERLTGFRQRAGAESVAESEAALSDQNLELAEPSARLALKLLEPVAGSQENQARALTVLAKVAFLQERLPEAAALARRAQQLAPNSDRQTRAASYAIKDARLGHQR
jgi:tetratricopeptide (TPR) repeat protein